MKAQFVDRQDPRNPMNGRTLSNSAELQSALVLQRDRPPFFAELIGENGFKLLLGLGRNDGCVQFSATDGSSSYLMAVASGVEDRVGEKSFLIGGELTPVPMRYCLPFETVVDIADEFIRTGRRKADVSWEEI